MGTTDIKFECMMCGRIFKSKKAHKCYDGRVVNYNEWDEVRECCVAGCNNLIAADINEMACYIHQDIFDRFRD